MFEFFRRGFQPAASNPPVARPTSFIDEIEAILQQRIAALPAPLPREVHVKTGPDGMLRIAVGLDTYSSPDQVPEPEIRDLIKAAVAEWEKR